MITEICLSVNQLGILIAITTVIGFLGAVILAYIHDYINRSGVFKKSEDDDDDW